MMHPQIRFCDIKKEYHTCDYSCDSFKQERFEATSESVQTEEIEINHSLSIEESESNDIRG